jgi:drug/metabolite transporter (DMT)-like permease
MKLIVTGRELGSGSGPARAASLATMDKLDVNLNRQQNIALGIGLMLLGILLFSVADVFGKWLAGIYSVGQILVFRSVAAVAILLPLAGKLGPTAFLTMPRPWLQFWRVVFGTGEVACFYLAVSVLPLANAMTYYLAGPIYVTLLAALLLHERVGWRRWSAILVGFAGVVVTLQPSLGSFGWPAVVAFLGSVLFAFLMIVTRALRGTSDTVMISTQMIASLIFGVVWAAFDWVPMSVRDMIITGLVGCVSMAALFCVNRSLRLAPASIVVPYQYTIIVWAALFGYLVFGDVPTAATLVGAAIIIAAGLFIFFREQAVEAHPEPGMLSER